MEAQKPWVLLKQDSHGPKQLSNRLGLLTAHAGAQEVEGSESRSSPGEKQKKTGNHEALKPMYKFQNSKLDWIQYEQRRFITPY